MTRALPSLGVLGLFACVAPPEAVHTYPASGDASSAAVDDGTYLERIDPLGGQWQVEDMAGLSFAPFKAWINFSGGGFLNHGAGCAGGFPAFYRIEGEHLTVTRIEPARTGRCAAATTKQRAAAIASEQRLATFMDRVKGWERLDAHTLVLMAKDGTNARLTRPSEPYPALAGRWLIENIAGKRFVTERRPAILTIAMGSMGANADCNSMGSSFTLPASGRIAVTGPMMSTAIGCPPEDAAEDDQMAGALTAATGYRIDGDQLMLIGGPGMTLRRAPLPDRRLVGEYVACGNTLLGGFHEGPITLSIDPTIIRDNAGCSASYEAMGPRLQVRLHDAPACAVKAPPFIPGQPVAVGGAISPLAVATPNGFGFNDKGQLILRTPRGLLTMCRKGAPPPFGN